MRNYPKSRKNKNIYFWMPKKSEKMLEKNGVTPTSWVKKSSVKISVSQ
jgi:hypothetical protein